jgi:RimJ/RimL family protein N-acetyltransferase
MHASEIGSERLTLTPLGPGDAEEMVGVLSDERLYEFTGGEPEDAVQLRERFERLVAGSGRDDETWLNWVVRRRSDDRPVGTVQATIERRGGERAAWVAWVVGVPWQGQGFATEAARALVAWLREQGVWDVAAAVAPGHVASERVAASAGLALTDQIVDGERVWRLGSSDGSVALPMRLRTQ